MEDLAVRSYRDGQLLFQLVRFLLPLFPRFHRTRSKYGESNRREKYKIDCHHVQCAPCPGREPGHHHEHKHDDTENDLKNSGHMVIEPFVQTDRLTSAISK